MRPGCKEEKKKRKESCWGRERERGGEKELSEKGRLGGRLISLRTTFSFSRVWFLRGSDLCGAARTAMAYGAIDGNRRLQDYISSVVEALSFQNGAQLAALLSVSRGSHCNSVANGLDQSKVSSLSCLSQLK